MSLATKLSPINDWAYAKSEFEQVFPTSDKQFNAIHHPNDDKVLPNAIAILPKSMGMGNGFVVLDPNTNSVLEQEGLVNDLVYYINQARRKAKLEVTDNIKLCLATCIETWYAVYWNLERIVKATKTEELEVNNITNPASAGDWTLAMLGGVVPFPVFIHVQKTKSTQISDLLNG